MPPSYDFKYAKKEWDKIQFKRDMKKEPEPFAEDAKLEMGELIESDPELYQGDSEKKPVGRRRPDNQDLSS